jgi:NAD(P)H dehydrogenase (quinone)
MRTFLPTAARLPAIALALALASHAFTGSAHAAAAATGEGPVPSITPPACWLGEGTQVLVAFVSDTGYTRALAAATAAGAAEVEHTCVWLLDARAAPVEMLAQADAVLVGAPVHNGNPASAMLEWIERWPFHGAPLRDRPGAVFVTGGGLHAGAESSLLALQRSLLSFSMLLVGGDAWQSAYGVAATTAEAPFAGKLLDAGFAAKARALGRRVATLARRLSP